MGDLGIMSRQCRQGFENLILHLTKAKPGLAAEMSAPDIQSQYGKFKVWCGNLGAFQTGYSSLDYRLRESAVMQSTVAKLLRQLGSALIESIAVVSGKRLPFEDQPKPADLSEESTDDSDSEEQKPRKELTMRLSSIIDCLNSLYRISYKIRNPNLRPSTSKAIYYQEIDPETKKDIFEHFRALDQNHVSELLSLLRQNRDAPADFAEYLSERLTDSVTLRRRYFKYWEKHSKKLSHDTRIGELIPGLNLADMETPSSPKTGEGLSTAEGKKPERRAESTVILSKTDATPYDTALDDRTEKATVVSFTSTALDIDGKGIELPGPPLQAKQGEEFTCPYCHVLCPAKQGRGKAWRQHVLHDLQPYICTYPDCSQHKELYRSRSQWVKHEESAHRQCWRCHEHPDIIHKSAASLKHHLATQHSKTLTDTQIEQLADIYSFTLVDDRENCPICFAKQPFDKGMANHLANHLERIALFSLPRSYSDSECVVSRSEEIASNGTDPHDSPQASTLPLSPHLSPDASMISGLLKDSESQDDSTDSPKKHDHGERIIASSSQDALSAGHSISGGDPPTTTNEGDEGLQEESHSTYGENKDRDQVRVLVRRGGEDIWMPEDEATYYGLPILQRRVVNKGKELFDAHSRTSRGFNKDREEIPSGVNDPRFNDSTLTSPILQASTGTTQHRMATSSSSGNSVSSRGIRVPLHVLSGPPSEPYLFFPRNMLVLPYDDIGEKLRKLLKNYSFEKIGFDETGFYVIFEDSLNGASGAKRCFQEVNFTSLFMSKVQDVHLSIPKKSRTAASSDHAPKSSRIPETSFGNNSPWGLRISEEESERIYGPLDDETEVNLEDLTKELFEKYGDDDWPMRDYAQWIRVMTMLPKTNAVVVPKRLILDHIKQLHEWRDLFRRGPGRNHNDISATEFREVLERLDYRVSRSVTDGLFRKWSLEPGGYLNFGQYMSSMALVKHITDMFVFLDNDRDGYATVSFEEFLTLFHRAVLHLGSD